MIETDPTMRLVEKLADESLWHIERGVPIFRAHKRYARDGKFLYEVTKDELPEISANTSRLSESGVFIRFTIGHTIPGAPQEVQPKVVGYGINPRSGTFGPTRIPAILCDQYITNEFWEEAKTYPYRSVEFYRKRGTITGVALLREDPELDLGMIVYERDELQFYARDSMAEEEEEIDEKEAKKFCRYAKHCYPHLERIHSEHASRYQGGPGMPSSTNVTTPGMVAQPAPPDPNVQRMQREEEALRYKQLEDRMTLLGEENKKLLEALEAERYARREARAEQQVTQLQGEGFQIKDRVKLVKKLAALNDDGLTEALTEIRDNYARVPVRLPTSNGLPGGEIPIARGSAAPKVTKRQHEMAVSMATRDPKMTYEEALAKVQTS